MNSAAAAFQAGAVGVDEKIVLDERAEQQTYCVVYVGDILTAAQKRAPRWRLGGKLFPWPDYRTVPDNIVPRCAITRLKPAMREIHKGQVEEKLWGNYQQSYTLTNQWDAERQAFVDIRVGERGDMLYKPLSPVAEIGMLTRDNSGVVVLEGDAMLTSGEEIRAAQLHYFTNWIDILINPAKLPTRIAELEDHIADRMAQTRSPKFIAVGEAYLFSCQQFREWAKNYIDTQTSYIDTWKGKGVTTRYDEIAERLFEVCDITREDKLISTLAKDQITGASANSQIAQALTGITELLKAQGVAVQVVPAENQAPAPTTSAEAAAEFNRASSDESYVDMTQAIAPEVEQEPSLEESLDALGDTEAFDND